MRHHERDDVVIVGGGLSGLAAAALLARAGRAVTLYERADAAGGRARTQDRVGYLLNQGPHALYRGGAASRVLRDLGVTWSGHTPRTAGYAIRGGVRYRFPGGIGGIVATRLLSPGARLELVRFLATLLRVDPEPLQGTTVAQWLRRVLRRDDARQFIAALIRVSTYAADAERQSAGAALAQVRLALTSNVAYLNGGWQTLVAGLRRVAETAGARIVTGRRVALVERDPVDGGVRGVRLADGERHDAAAAVIAAGPQDALALVEHGDDTALRAWAEAARPVRAACLDLALTALPDPRAPFALGIDRPLYFSVHTAPARLAPGTGAVIHAAKYLGNQEEGEPPAIRRELEALADLVQPGWRERVLVERFLPAMIVTNRLVTAAQGGLPGRPGPAVPEAPGLFVAGDWVGPDGMLADAALASAAAAAAAIVAGAQRAGARSQLLVPSA